MNQTDKIDIMHEALQQILNWALAYPVAMFPEPDWKKCAELLRAGGIELAWVSGSNMRHCLEGVGSIAKAALESVQD
jgi:hypothetical protein